MGIFIPAPTTSTPLALNAGGTGGSAASANAAFNLLSPMSTVGDIIYENATPVGARLPIGSTSQILTVVGGLPSWQTPSGGSTVFSDSVFRIQDNGDATKQLAFEASGIATATTRTITVPDSDLNLSTGGTGSFAAINLANVSTMASSITPDTTGTRSLGTSGVRLAQIWSDRFAGRTGIADKFYIDPSVTTPSGATSIAALYDPLASGLAVFTSNRATNGSAPLYLETGSNGGTTFAGGIINIATGANTNAGNAVTGGSVSISTGSHAGTGASGPINLTTGGNSGGAASGPIALLTGNATGSAGATGNISITAGNIANTSNHSTAGSISITAGSSNTLTSGSGGSITLTSGGTTTGGNSAPTGDIILITPASAGVGAHGKIKFQDNTQGTVGHVWTQTVSDGTGSWQTVPAAGANTSLSNLASTSINADLVPSAANARRLGNGTQWLSADILRTQTTFSPDAMVSGLLTGVISGRTGVGVAHWGLANFPTLAQDALYLTSMDDGTANAIATAPIIVSTGSKTAGTGATGAMSLITGDSTGGAAGAINIQTGKGVTGSGALSLKTSDGTAGTFNGGAITVTSGAGFGIGGGGAISLLTGTTVSGSSGSVNVTTGNTPSGGLVSGSINLTTGNNASSFASGDILLAIGTGSLRGKIRKQDGSQGTVGHVWTSTDTTGGGAWQAASGGGANVTLSNLTNPTAINQDLTFAAAAHGMTIATSAAAANGNSLALSPGNSGAGTNLLGGSLNISTGLGTGSGTAAGLNVNLTKITASGTTAQTNYNALNMSAYATNALELDIFSPSGENISMFVSAAGHGIATGTQTIGTLPPEFFISQGQNTGSGGGGNIRFQAGNVSNAAGSGGAILMTAGSAGSTSGTTGAIALATQDSPSATGNSGNITLTVGNTTGGSRGLFKFLKTGAPSVSGQVWTASATDGTGYWANAGAPGNLSVVSKTTTYTATTSDDVILASTAGGAYTITLPSPSNTGKVLRIKKTTSDFTVLTITTPSGNLEAGSGTASTTINTQYEQLTLVADGTNWAILDRDYGRLGSVWTGYTATFSAGFGTTTGTTGFMWRRVAGGMRIMGSRTTGTVAASIAQASLPTGANFDSTQSPTNQQCGFVLRATAAAPIIAVLGTGGSNNLTFARTATAAISAFTSENGSAAFASTELFKIDAHVPIDGWN